MTLSSSMYSHCPVFTSWRALPLQCLLQGALLAVVWSAYPASQAGGANPTHSIFVGVIAGVVAAFQTVVGVWGVLSVSRRGTLGVQEPHRLIDTWSSWMAWAIAFANAYLCVQLLEERHAASAFIFPERRNGGPPISGASLWVALLHFSVETQALIGLGDILCDGIGVRVFASLQQVVGIAFSVFIIQGTVREIVQSAAEQREERIQRRVRRVLRQEEERALEDRSKLQDWIRLQRLQQADLAWRTHPSAGSPSKAARPSSHHGSPVGRAASVGRQAPPSPQWQDVAPGSWSGPSSSESESGSVTSEGSGWDNNRDNRRGSSASSNGGDDDGGDDWDRLAGWAGSGGAASRSGSGAAGSSDSESESGGRRAEE